VVFVADEMFKEPLELSAAQSFWSLRRTRGIVVDTVDVVNMVDVA
jgi:hypothetical protein